MSPDRWQHVKQLFDAALERAPEERGAFLDEVCRGDEELRREVTSLIASAENEGSFMERPAVSEAIKAIAEGQGRLAVGRRISRYEVLSLLGAGGMGEVYLARDSRLGRRVALKLLSPEVLQNGDRLRRFEQEAFAASSLNHPNIITIHEIDHHEHAPFIATEYIDGVTLREHTAGKVMKITEALDIAVQVASALSAAHQAGIVHRDIKPENIMLRRDGFVKVLDFGLAKLTQGMVKEQASDSEAATKPMINTEPGVVMGTVAYMSPEQTKGIAVDARTDIWSLGVVLYEMLSGHVPFEGSTNSHVIVSILEKEPVSLAQYRQEVPPELQRIVRKALRKDPEERYQTAKDFGLDLKNLRRELEISAELEYSVPLVKGNDSAAVSGSEQSVAFRETEKIEARTDGQAESRPTSSAEYFVAEIKRHKRGAALAVAILTTAITGVAFALHKLISQNGSGSAKLFREMKIAKLTNNGKTFDAAISPDGKYVVYVVENEGQQNLWLKHITTDSNVPITAPAAVVHRGLTFSPDSSYILYTTLRKNELVADLSQIPVLGGTPKKLLSDLDIYGSISFSPDGKQFAFIRDSKEEAALMIANADGTEERKLASRNMPERFIKPAWSPDGKTIACPVFVLDSSGGYFNVLSIEVEGGAQRPLLVQRWQAILNAAWLGDGSGLVMLSRQRQTDPFQLWQVPLPDGKARRISNDLNSYSALSLTNESNALVTIQNNRNSNIWVVTDGGAGRAEQITSASTPYGYSSLSWTPDERIVYSRYSGNQDIWIIGSDGKGEKQLTAEAGDNYYPSISADGRYVVFESWRNDVPNLWRADVDGGNLKQLTNGHGGYPECSPAAPWVVYWSNYNAYNASDNKLWKKVHLEGGAPVVVTDKCRPGLAISPDGSQIACRYRDEAKTLGKVAIIPLEGGEPVKIIEIPETNGGDIRAWGLRWTADGRSLTYIQTTAGVSNIWSQPVDGGPPKQLTDFKTEQIFNFAWSRDGKQLALARGVITSDIVTMSDFR